MTAAGEGEVRRVLVTREGPILVEGPVEILTEDGHTVVSQRTVVAVCGCKRSRRYPLCDTSHRKRSRTPAEASPASSTEPT
jgi:CDGSH-type Zn-finger protein